MNHQTDHSHHAVPDNSHPASGMEMHAHHDVESGANNHHDHDRHSGHSVEMFRRRFWRSLALTVPILLLSPMIQMWLGEAWRFPGDLWLLFALSTWVFIDGGAPFLRGLWTEMRSARPGMMTLVAVAITVSYAYSAAIVFGLSGEDFFWELATLIDLMLLGHWIEMRSIKGASRALESLARLMPADAHRRTPDGGIEDVPLSALAVGDRVLVRPGEKAPADGTIVEGETSLNESMLTGESRPVHRTVGEAVIGGSVNGEGSIEVAIERIGVESFLAQVVELVRRAQQSRSRAQDLADRAALWLTVIAVVGGAATFTIWLLTGATLAFAVERAVTVMVISCPHALGLAVPLVVAVSTGLAARNGLLIRDRSAFENADRLRTVIFDKTGTLTTGTFSVSTVITNNEIDQDELLRLAATVEERSQHPIALAIAGATPQRGVLTHFHSITGRGTEGTVDGRKVIVASPSYLRDKHLDPLESAASLGGEGRTVIHVMIDGEVAGAIALEDTIRPESIGAVRDLKALGIRSVMITGDAAEAAQGVAARVGISDVRVQVLPDGKAAAVEEIRGRDGAVGMVGDGVNDAPALAAADLGVAIGAGTDVAAETADVVLVRSNPLDVVQIIALARATRRKMIQNLWWAAGYNIITIPLAAGLLAAQGILLSPAVGAILMSSSTIIVAINARLLKANKRIDDNLSLLQQSHHSSAHY